MFDYGILDVEVSDLHDKIKACNRTIFNLENASAAGTEEELNKEDKKLSIDLKDTQKRIQLLARGLSGEKVREAEAKQKQLTELRDKKAQLSELGITIKEALRFIDEDLTTFNKEIIKINTLAGKLQFAQQFKTGAYTDAEGLHSLITIVREELRQTIGEIEKFQKELDERRKESKNMRNYWIRRRSWRRQFNSSRKN